MRFVPADDLEPGMILGRDIISSKNSHMLRIGVTLTIDYVIYIQTNGYLGAYIVDDISENVEIEENTVDAKLFAQGIKSVEEGNIGGIVKTATDIAEEISNSSEINLDLMDLRSYDDYTYHHSVNVAVYSTIVGKKLNVQGEKLNLLCQAGLCHDLGKTKISLEILNKPTRLTDEEYTLVKNHSKMSYEILAEHSDISALVKQAVYMHHENENGTGYPLGKMGNDIPLFAKIIHACDVYDALTSRRPYKNPYSAVEALEYLKNGAGVLFDKKIVEAILQVVPAYPPGIEVILSNGEHAIVVAHTANAMRPKIKLVEKNLLVNLSTDEAYKDVKIVKSSHVENDFVGSIAELNESRQKVKEQKQVIAIVDDEKTQRMQAEKSIQGDYSFVHFESGLAFLNYLDAHKAPDLVILDINMPLFDGVQTAKKIREKGFLHMPIMFLTAASDPRRILECRRVGAIDYILKPCKPVYLNERVEIALKNVME